MDVSAPSRIGSGIALAGQSGIYTDESQWRIRLNDIHSRFQCQCSITIAESRFINCSNSIQHLDLYRGKKASDQGLVDLVTRMLWHFIRMRGPTLSLPPREETQ